MRGRCKLAVPTLLAVLLFVYCAESSSSGSQRYAKKQILVRWKYGATLKLESRFSLKRMRAVGSQGWTLYTIPENSTVEEILRQLNSQSDVALAEPNYLVFPTEGSGGGGDGVLPTDTRFPEQWHLKKVSADRAWQIDTGSMQVKVCVIDSGARIDHPDLKANIYKGFNLVPEDQVTPGKAPTPEDPWYYNYNDTVGHGTPNAGTIGAVGNNGVGVSGVAWRIQLVICKFIWDWRPGIGFAGYIDDALTCLKLCRAEGAMITSNSWGGLPYFSQSLYDEIKTAGEGGQLFITAAANAGVDTDVTPQYPGAFDLDNIVTVGSVNSSDFMSEYSNYGKKSVHIFAPGEGILSASNNGGYDLMWGTSAAAPIVAGTAALIQATAKKYGVTLPYQRIKYHLLQGVDEVPRLANACVAGGRLNVYKALQSTLVEVDPVGEYVIRQTAYTLAADCGTWVRTSRPAWRQAATDLFEGRAQLRCQFAGVLRGGASTRLRITLSAKVSGVRLSEAKALADRVGTLIASGTFRKMVDSVDPGDAIALPRLGDGYCVVGYTECPPQEPAVEGRWEKRRKRKARSTPVSTAGTAS